MALLALALTLAIAGYALLCAVSPFGRCRKCSGTGFRDLSKRRPKPCRRCRGQRYRPRIGTRTHTTSRAIHQAGTRLNRTRQP